MIEYMGGSECSCKIKSTTVSAKTVDYAVSPQLVWAKNLRHSNPRSLCRDRGFLLAKLLLLEQL